MKKAKAGWTVCLAASIGLAASVLLAQSQSQKPAPNVSATRPNVTALEAQNTPQTMQTGLWQTTMTGKYMGLPPQMAAAINPTMTYKSCVEAKALTSHEWAKQLVGFHCSSINVVKSTSTDAVVQATGCNVGNRGTADGIGHFHLAPSGRTLTGSLNVTFSGNNPLGGNGTLQVQASNTSNWIGATCPADVK